METRKPLVEGAGPVRKPWLKPEMVSEPIQDAFQAGCAKCDPVAGPLVGCGSPSKNC